MHLNAGCASEALTSHVKDALYHAYSQMDMAEHDPTPVFKAVDLLVGSGKVGRIWLGHRIATNFPTHTPLVIQRLGRIDKSTTAVSDPG